MLITELNKSFDVPLNFDELMYIHSNVDSDSTARMYYNKKLNGYNIILLDNHDLEGDPVISTFERNYDKALEILNGLCEN